jgi:hydroxymethylglutaryl-CoA lyase
MKSVRLVDVTLRDGLQLAGRILSLEEKVALWRSAIAVLLPTERVEVTSFVSPKWVPQFADAGALVDAVVAESSPDVLARCMAFVPNDRGLDRFLATPFGWAAGFLSVTETFHEKNVNTSRADTLAHLPTWVKRCHDAGRKFRLYLSTAFGCPYEGAVAEADVVRSVAQAVQAGVDEVAVSDTLGVALPESVERTIQAIAGVAPLTKVALHLHNTYGFAAAAALAGAKAGVGVFDGALGGLGGCPFAKGATGNVALEDLAYAFARTGARPVADWTPFEAAVSTLAAQGHPVRSRLGELWSRGGTPRML